VQKKASERLQALEHPAIDVLARFLTAPELATTFSAMLHPSTVLNPAKIVLERTGHKPTDKLEISSRQLLDVNILSTSTLRLAARLDRSADGVLHVRARQPAGEALPDRRPEPAARAANRRERRDDRPPGDNEALARPVTKGGLRSTSATAGS
jgi:hypothetical protein